MAARASLCDVGRGEGAVVTSRGWRQYNENGNAMRELRECTLTLPEHKHLGTPSDHGCSSVSGGASLARTCKLEYTVPRYQVLKCPGTQVPST